MLEVSMAGSVIVFPGTPGDQFYYDIGYADSRVRSGQSQSVFTHAAVGVRIEQGGHGSSVAAPVVRYVLEAYFGVEHAVLGGLVPTE